MNSYGSLNNRLEEQKQAEKIEVGMGVTELLWSDRHAWYIDEIVRCNSKGEPIELKLVRAKHKCIDYYAGKWEVFPYEEADKTGFIHIYRTRKDKEGRYYWTMDGIKKDRNIFAIGVAREYEDPSF